MSKPIYMSIHDMEWHETAQAVKTMPIARRPESPETRSRSELTLLYELIKRNPERAKEFLDRLRRSVQQAA